MSPFDIIPSSFFNKPWHRFRNTSGQEIPAYACMRIVDAIEVDNDIVFEVDQPNDEDQPFYLVNGPLAVPANTAEGEGQAAVEKEGRGTTLMQAGYVLVSGGPTFGDVWGPTNGTWEISGDGKGFLMLGSAVSDPTRAAAVQQMAAGNPVATAELTEDMCGELDEELTIANFCLVTPGEVEIPSTAFNRLARQGPSGQRVKLEYWLKDPSDCSDFPHWAITKVQPQEADVLSEAFWDAEEGCFKGKRYKAAALEFCGGLETFTIYCPPVCDV